MFKRIIDDRLVTRAHALLATAGLLAVAACSPPPAAMPDDASAAPVAEAPAAEQEAPLPSAEEVLEKSVAAVGGRALLDSIESYYSESKMEVASQNISASTKVWWKKGDFYSETDMPGLGVTKMWGSGGEMWGEDPINGWRKLDGAEARQAQWTTTLSLVADWKRFFSSAETVGRREHEGMTLIDVLMKSDDGDEMTLSFDAESGLLRQQQFKQESPMGLMPITVDIEDYEDYGGMKHATRLVANMAVIEAVTAVTKFEVNVEIDEAKFKPEEPKKPDAAKKAKK